MKSGDSLTCIQLLAANSIIVDGYKRRIENYRLIKSPQQQAEQEKLNEWRNYFTQLITQLTRD